MDSTEVLPSTLRFATPPTLPQAREYSYSQPSTESYYDCSTKPTIQIDIPRLQRSYLEKTSRLQFTASVEISNAAAYQPGRDTICLDTPGAYSFIDTIEVYDYLGSTLLERIEGVAQLMALVMDTVPADHPLSYNNESQLGTVRAAILENRLFYDNIATTTNQIGGSTATQNSSRTLTKTLDSLEGPTSGIVFNVRNAVATSSTYTYSADFSLPLYSFLGLLSEKLVPLHNGFTLMITLNNGPQAIGCASPAAIITSSGHADIMKDVVLSNVSFRCDILELGPTAENLVLTANGEGPLTIHTKSFRHYTKQIDGSVDSTDGTVASTSKSYTWSINFNASSVTSVLWFMRPNNTQNNYLYRSLSHRIRNNLVSWRFKYGSSTLPNSTGIICSANNTVSTLSATNLYAFSGSDALGHLLKARRISTSPVITNRSFNIDGYTTKYTANVVQSSATGATTTATRLDQLLNVLVPGGVGVAGYTDMTLAAANIPSYSQTLPFYHVPPPGRFACGLSTTLVNTGNTISGLNTNGMATSIETTFIPCNTTIAVPTTDEDKFQYMYSTGSRDILPSIADIYMEYDAFVSILPNISTNVSF